MLMRDQMISVNADGAVARPAFFASLARVELANSAIIKKHAVVSAWLAGEQRGRN